jgi:DNA-binding PadR family transcriptional regulator
MRVLKYAILGLINKAPITGYDIAKEFDRDSINFWHATHGQIYPELRRLTEEGLITYKIDTKGDKLEKKLYILTEEGRKNLKEWLSTRDKLEPTPKVIFRLKLYYLNNMDREQIKIQLKNQLRQRDLKLKKLQGFMAKQKSSNVNYGKRFDEELGDYLVLQGAIMREKNNIEWLNFCAHYLETIE